MTRFGALVARVDERQPGVELPLMSVSQTRGVIRRSELTDKPPRAENLDAYKICRRGDVVFNKMSIRAGAMGVAGEDGLVTYHYEVMRPFEGTDARFVTYLMKSSWFTKELILRERGIGAGDQVNVRTTEVPFRVMRTIDCPVPSAETQRRIADYLDYETAQIDTLISEQERLLDLLEERRVAVLEEHLVVGEPVPVRRVISRLRQGWSPNCEAVPADGIAEWGVLKVGCGNTGAFDWRENKRLPADVEPRVEHVVQAGEVVMSRSNTKDLVGAAAVVPEGFPRLLLSDLNYALTPSSQVSGEFLAFALNAPFARAQVALASKGTSPSMQKISQREVLALTVRIPDRVAQDSVVVRIREAQDNIDRMVEESARLIDLARERRAALITAAVTGQIEIQED